MKYYLIFSEYNDFGEFNVTTNPKLHIHNQNKEFAKFASTNSQIKVKYDSFYTLRYIKEFKTITEALKYMKIFMSYLDRRLTPVFMYDYAFEFMKTKMDTMGKSESTDYIPGSLIKNKLK